MKNKKIFIIFGIMLYAFFLVVTMLIDKKEYLLTQGFYFVILLVLNKFIFNSEDVLAKRYAIFGYIYISFIAILLIWHHNLVYNWDFDIWGDDRRFFQEAVYYKYHIFESSYSGYEKLLAIVLLFFNLFDIKDSPSLLLPLNWMVAGLTIGLSYKLALKLVKIELPFFLFFLSIFLNYTFVQNSIHLYRDIYVAFFSILAILAILDRRYIDASLFSVLSGIFRFPNAIFNLFLIGIKLLVDKNKKSILYFSILLFAFSMVATYAVKTKITISKYEMGHIVDMLDKRNEKFLSELDGGIAMLYDLPEPLRFIVNIPFQVIRPITMKSAYTSNFDHRKLGNSITTLSLIILAAYYIRGLIIGLTTNNKEYRFFIYTLILYAVIIGYFSFLDRNRIILIPLFPALIALAYSKELHSHITRYILYYMNKKVISLFMLVMVLILGK